MTYEEIVRGMQEAELLSEEDRYDAHISADILLKKCALHTGLSKKQREHIIEIYDKVGKWYG